MREIASKSLEICKRADLLLVQTCKLALDVNLQTCKLAHLKTCKLTNLPLSEQPAQSISWRAVRDAWRSPGGND